jgi:hypothetical protein
MVRIIPPPQILGPRGIEPNPDDLRVFDYERLARLPPFQMFAAEVQAKAPRDDALQHALEVVRVYSRTKLKDGTQELYDAYAEWHAAKGLWPGETPDGLAAQD